jgi:type IV pilus assembly protein PilO
MELPNDIQSKLEPIAKLPKAARIGILVGVGVLVCVVYYFGFYQGADEKLQQLRAKELELQRKLSEVRSIAANLSAFETEIGELELQLAEALRQLPNEKQLEVLLTDISNLGKTAGVEISSFQRREEKIHDFYAEVPIDIALEGQYHDIARFFDLMSKLPRIVNMGALSVTIGSESVEETRLKVSGTATTFRFVGSGEKA